MNKHYNLLSARLIKVTPILAGIWLKQYKYQNHQKMRESHIDRLATEIKNGRFIAGTQIHFGKVNKKIVILNGYRILAAIARSGVTIPLTVMTTRAKSEKALARLYASFDTHMHPLLDENKKCYQTAQRCINDHKKLTVHDIIKDLKEWKSPSAVSEKKQREMSGFIGSLNGLNISLKSDNNKTEIRIIIN